MPVMVNVPLHGLKSYHLNMMQITEYLICHWFEDYYNWLNLKLTVYDKCTYLYLPTDGESWINNYIYKTILEMNFKYWFNSRDSFK